MKAYFAELAEMVGGLACALFNHVGGCALLRYKTRRWNPIAFLYHWGTDVAFANGRKGPRCGCRRPIIVVESPSHTANGPLITFPRQELS